MAEKKALKWSSYTIFMLYGSTNGGVDTKIKIPQCCISKLQAFAKIAAGYPIATTQNCIYFEIGMRYLHNFCFYTPIFDLGEHKCNTRMTPRCIFWTKIRFLLIFGLKWGKF